MSHKDEDDELKNFPPEMAEADDEQFHDYTQYRRNPKDSDVMKRVWFIFARRLFPVLSLSYIASVLGICLSRGTHFLFDNEAHMMAMIIMICSAKSRRKAPAWPGARSVHCVQPGQEPTQARPG